MASVRREYYRHYVFFQNEIYIIALGRVKIKYVQFNIEYYNIIIIKYDEHTQKKNTAASVIAIMQAIIVFDIVRVW